MVYCQNINRDLTDLSASAEVSSIPLKIFIPNILSRVEEAYDITSVPVKSGQIWPFVRIASQATPRKILGSCQSMVLLSDDVVDLERRWVVRFWHVTVLTRFLCPFLMNS